MALAKTRSLLLVFLFVLLQTNYLSFCQTRAYPINEWAKQLQSKNDPKPKNMLAIEDKLLKVDNAAVDRILLELEKDGPSSNHYFNA